MAEPVFVERRFTAEDGLELYYRDYGDPLAAPTPVMCLAGLTRNSKDFHTLGTRLAASRRMVALDYRGRGRSERSRDWRRYEPRVYLNDIRHLLAAAGLHRVVVVGTSLGGLLAMGLGVMQPLSLAGVVLNDVGPDVSPSGLDRIVAANSVDRTVPDWDTAIRQMKGLYGGISPTSEEGWRRRAEATFRPGEDGRLRVDWDVNLFRALQRARAPVPDLWPLFRALRPFPVLALRGARSDVLRAETLARMASEKPDLIQVTVADAGHAPDIDHPQARSAIDDFLSDL